MAVQSSASDMTARKGFLLVTMEPPPPHEEEFNDWYDTEHVPGRLGIAGFETGLRFVCVSGWPKYLSFYDLSSIGVLESAAYKAAAWGGFSPWTKRMLTKVRGQYRASGDQVYPGDALTGEMCRLTLVRFRHVPEAEAGLVEAGARASFEKRPETVQVRVLKSTYNDDNDYLALVEARAPLPYDALDLEPFGAAARRIDMVNHYTPYWTRGKLAGVYPGT
jgi:hypothetical protein